MNTYRFYINWTGSIFIANAFEILEWKRPYLNAHMISIARSAMKTSKNYYEDFCKGTMVKVVDDDKGIVIPIFTMDNSGHIVR